jgi:serine protease
MCTSWRTFHRSRGAGGCRLSSAKREKHRPAGNPANIAPVKTRARILAALLLAVPPLHLVAAQVDTAGTERIIVKWRASTDAPAVRQQRTRELAQRLGNPFTRGHNLGGNLSVLQLATRQRGLQLQQTLATLRADPSVELAQVDERLRATYLPSDPLFAFRTSYRGTLLDYQWYLKDAQPAAIRAETAWDITHAGDSPGTSPVVIAVLDTGIRPDHPDFDGKLLPGFDFISTAQISNDLDGWDPDPTDTGDFITAQDLQTEAFKGCGGGDDADQPTTSSWHGTRVAGLIGARTDNGIGSAGAAFNVRIVPVRVLGKCGGYLSDVLAGMYWAAGFYDEGSGHPIPAPILADPGALRGHRNMHPAQVINMSLGAPGACSEMYQTAVRDITAIGVLIVAAAGNDGGGVDKPANCQGVLAVAGLRHSGTKVGYSNLGGEVGIAAPAGNCLLVASPQDPNPPCVYALTTLTDSGLLEPNADTYSTPFLKPSFGTSFSAPLASATAGLMKAVNPALTPAQLILRIKASARAFPTTSDTTPLPPACVSPLLSSSQGAECICNTEVCGAGMLDAAGAVQLALRPAANARVKYSAGKVELDGSSSAAAVAEGRTIVSHAWTVQSVSDGASTPAITNSDQLVASIRPPRQGRVTLLLTVTDSAGDTDTTSVSVAGTGGGGGGGSTDAAWLALLLLLVARRAFPFPPLLLGFQHGSTAGLHPRAGRRHH